MPTTTGIATEFIQFSRTTNATLTDSDGKIKWAPHNFLLASEQFDSASWAKTTTTVAANSIAAPNGTTTADTLTAAGANSTTLQSYTALAVPYTFGVWLRRKTGTGDIQIAADSGTYTTVTITSSWALYTVSQTPVAGTISAGIRIVTSADEVYAWGAHLYRADLSMQNNTSAYPTYNPTTPKNLFGNTESFDVTTFGWTKFNATITSNIITAPNGLVTGDKIVATTATGYHGCYQSITLGAGTYTISVYAKAAEYSLLRISDFTSGAYAASFNLASGVVSSTAGPKYVSSAMSSVGSDGWWRCSIVVANVSALGATVLGGYPSGATLDAYGAQYTGDGTSGIYLWGAQLSDSASLDPYFPSYSTAPTAAAYYGPRRDFNGSTLACNGLLVEEQKTNELIRSAEFDSAAVWFLDAATVSPNVPTEIAPDGTTSADKLVENLATSAHDIYQTVGTSQPIGTYTYSMYVKASGRTKFRLQQSASTSYAVLFDLTALTATTVVGGATGVITNAGNGWYRCAMTYTTVTAFAPLLVLFLANSAGSVSYAGDGTSGVLMWGAQLEAGSFATSYMPTIATTFQRNVDVANVSIQAFPYNSAEGTLVVNVTKNFLGGDSVSSALYLTSSSNTMELFFNSADSRLYAATGGALQVNLVDSGKVVAGATTKAGFAYATNNYALSTNGGTILPATTATVPPVATLGIGSRNSGLPFRGWIRQVTYLPRRVTNAELQARTA